MNEALLDVNVLIAAVVENHVDHARVLAFLSTLERFHTTPTTQGGFLRFLTRPWKDAQKQEHPPRMTVADALQTLRDVIASPKHAFLADDELFTKSGHRQWTDAYLLRLAQKHGLSFATLERKLDNMDDLRAPSLLVVP
jgi:uncharacterized protein